MKYTLILFLALFSSGVYGQRIPDFNDTTWHWNSGATLSYPSMNGLSLRLEIGSIHRLNSIKMSLGMQTQVGNIAKGFIIPEFYNDKYYDVAVLYGRLFQFNRLLIEVDAGGNYYLYKDKWLEQVQSTGYIQLDHYKTVTTSYTGIGFISNGSVSFIISQKVMVGGEFSFWKNNAVALWTVGFRSVVLF